MKKRLTITLLMIGGFLLAYSAMAQTSRETLEKRKLEKYIELGDGNFNVVDDIYLNGKMGVGTTSPLLPIHIYGSQSDPASSGTTPFGFLALKADGTHGGYLGMQNVSPFGLWLQAQDKSDLSINYPILLNPNGGNVGVGTKTPGVKLDVSGTIRTNQQLDIGMGAASVGADPGIYLGDSASADDYGHIYWDTSDSVLKLVPQNESLGIAINNSGYVGIGINPSVAFDVNKDTAGDYGFKLINGSATGGGLYVYGGSNSTSYNLLALDNLNGNKFVVRSDGNVGIGTSSPSYKLDVNGEARIATNLRLSNLNTCGNSTNPCITTASGTSVGVFFEADKVGFGTGSSSKYSYLNTNGEWIVNGNVGIGTSSPGHKLNVSAEGTSNTAVLGINVSGSDSYNWASSAMAPNLTAGEEVVHFFGFAESIANSAYIGYKHAGDGSASNALVMGLFNTNDAFVLNASGSVGIGTSSPSEKLHVVGSSILLSSGTNYNDVGTIGLSDARSWIKSKIIDGTANGDTALTFGTRVTGVTAPRMVIDHFGKVGINTGETTGNQYLNISGVGSSTDTAASISLWDENSGASRRWSISNGAGGNAGSLLGKLVFSVGSGSYTADPMAGTAVMTLNSSGYVGISTTNPEYKFQINDGSIGIYRTSNSSFPTDKTTFGYAGTDASPTQVLSGYGMYQSTYFYTGSTYFNQGYTGWRAESDITSGGQSSYVIADNVGADLFTLSKFGNAKAKGSIKTGDTTGAGIFSITAVSGNHCDTHCADNETGYGFTNPSGTCLKAWDGSSNVIACNDTTATRCLCAGAF